MFFISEDPTEEWDRYLLAGSSGWSMIMDAALLKTLPFTSISPSKKAAFGPNCSVGPPAKTSIPSPEQKTQFVTPPPVKTPPAPPLALPLPPNPEIPTPPVVEPEV